MNKVTLIGRLTKDPEIRYSAGSQTAVARFSLAIDRGKKANGEDAGTDFPNIVAFGKTAELVEKYVVKVQQLAVEGRIQTGSYERDGVKRYTTDIVAERVEFLGKKESSNTLPKGIVKTEDKDDVYSVFSSITDDDIPF